MKVLRNLENGAPFYENYANVQFLSVDLDHNYKFRNLVSKVLEKAGRKLEDLIMIALEAKNNKIQFLFRDGISGFEDWFDAILHREK
jgi:hypothetical protein